MRKNTIPAAAAGIVRFPFRRQPNGFTCGSTCVRMLLDHLEFRLDLSITELSALMGTNPRTGTTEVEMQRGLSLSGLTHERPSVNGFESPGAALAHLRDTLGRGNAVILRTLVHGCKHWVVVHGHVPRGDFLVTCPSAGFQLWNPARLHEAWSARGYDHFSAAGSRSLHPRALELERMERRAAWRPVHEMSLREFVGNVPVVPDAKQVHWHRKAIAEAAGAILSMAASGQGRAMSYGPGSAYVFRAVPGDGSIDDMLAIDTSSGTVAGGIHNGLRWVHRDFRGRGLGAELALCACSEPEARFLCPTSYSEAGHGSRVLAHRIAVRRALDAGMAVPEKALRTDADPDVADDPPDRQLRLL